MPNTLDAVAIPNSQNVTLIIGDETIQGIELLDGGVSSGFTYRKKHAYPSVFADIGTWNLFTIPKICTLCFQGAKISNGFMTKCVTDLLTSYAIHPEHVKNIFISLGLNDEKTRKFRGKSHAYDYAAQSCRAVIRYFKPVCDIFTHATIIWLGCGYIKRFKNGFPTNHFHFENIHTQAVSIFQENEQFPKLMFRNVYKYFEDCDVDEMGCLTQSGGQKVLCELKQLIIDRESRNIFQ